MIGARRVMGCGIALPGRFGPVAIAMNALVSSVFAVAPTSSIVAEMQA